MHAAFRAIIRPRLIRPAIAVAGGLGLTFGLSRESVHAEMKRAAQDLKKLLPADLVMDQDLAAFNKYADDDGNISNGSFVNAMHELGVHNENVIGSFFRCFDKAGNGVISFEEFVTSIAAIQPSGDPTDRLKFVFQSCDLNGNGKIEKEELRRMIHALLVTRENLHVYQTNYYGPKDWNERKLKRERQLQNHRRKSYPSTGFVDYKESEQLSIFDEWNRAVLIRKNEESDDYEPNAVFISKTTPYGNQPALQNSTEEQKKRLHELYAEFPKLQGKSLNQCLATLSESFATQVFKYADTNQDSVISYDEFESWTRKNSKDAKFLFSLYSDFHMIDADKQSMIPTIAIDDTLELTQDFGLL